MSLTLYPGESYSPRKPGVDEHPSSPTVGISRVKNVARALAAFTLLSFPLTVILRD